MTTILAAPVSRRALLRRALTSAAGLGALALVGPGAVAAAVASPVQTRGSVVAGAVAAAAPARVDPRRIEQAGTAAWSFVPTLGGPLPRGDHSLSLDAEGGVLYLFGGRNADGVLGDLWALDLATSTWTELVTFDPKPAARFGHNAFFDMVGRRLLVTLGQAGTAFFNDVWAFNPGTGLWSELGLESPERPQVRYGSGAAFDLLGDRFFVTHGFTSQGRFDDTWFFDLAASVWNRVPTVGALPEPRCLTRAAWDPVGQQLLLFGGQSNTAPFLGDFWTLNSTLGVWAQRAYESMPGPRNFYAASFDDPARTWYLFGGSTANGKAGDVWAYDGAADAWSALDTAGSFETPAARSNQDLAGFGSALYLFGGKDSVSDLNDLWTLQLSMPEMPAEV